MERIKKEIEEFMKTEVNSEEDIKKAISKLSPEAVDILNKSMEEK